MKLKPSPTLGTIISSPIRTECHTDGENYIKPSKACEYYDGTLNVAVFGDIHSVEVAYALAERLKENGKKIKHLSFSS